jgi:hypothetical protein
MFLSNVIQMVKVIICPCAHHKGIWWQQKYSSTHSLPQNLMELSGQFHVLTAIPQQKGPQLPAEWDDGLAPELVWIFWARKISCPCWELNHSFFDIKPVV